MKREVWMEQFTNLLVSYGNTCHSMGEGDASPEQVRGHRFQVIQFVDKMFDPAKPVPQPGKANLTPAEMLSAAITLAAKKFDGVFDKGGQPYILHCLKVMHYLKTDDLELQCIAVLHDVIEDCGFTVNDFQALGFSDRVIDGVVAMTKFDGYGEQEYLDQILENADAIRVKLADLRHNSDIRRLKGLRPKDFERLEKYHRMFVRLKEAASG